MSSTSQRAENPDWANRATGARLATSTMNLERARYSAEKFAFICIFVLGCGGTRQTSADAQGATAAERRCIEEATARPKALENPPETVTISHIVVRHKSLAEPQGASRTRGQACLRALEAREELRDGVEWADVVERYSDAHEPNDGELGTFKKSDLHKRLRRAAFSLQPRELSYVVETEHGFEIVLRTK